MAEEMIPHILIVNENPVREESDFFVSARIFEELFVPLQKQI